MRAKHNLYLESPVGTIELVSDEAGVRAIHFLNDAPDHDNPDELLQEAGRQLQAYFSGSSREFSFPVSLSGSAFQMRVWDALRNIPFGTTTTYGILARQLGEPNLTRAVGFANGSNPLAIVIPCHRVIGSNGKLTGYAGGLSRKQWLLEHEQRESQLRLF